MSDASIVENETPGHGHDDRHYIRIWGILVALLVVSVIGPMLGIRIVTLITAFGIAVVKAYLVCKHFMHLNVQPRYVVYFLVTGILFMVLLFAGVAPDVMSHEGQQWENVAAREEIARALGRQERPADDAPFEAATVFETTCSPCHGPGGAGDGPAAAALDPRPANFTDATFWATRDRDSIVHTITVGGTESGLSASMPAFGDTYDEEQIGELADLIIGLAPEGALDPAVDDASVDAGVVDGSLSDADASVDAAP